MKGPDGDGDALSRSEGDAKNNIDDNERSKKTGISTKIVQEMKATGARFLKEIKSATDGDRTGGFIVLSDMEARDKVSMYCLPRSPKTNDTKRSWSLIIDFSDR
jgi:hypothetical protein